MSEVQVCEGDTCEKKTDKKEEDKSEKKEENKSEKKEEAGDKSPQSLDKQDSKLIRQCTQVLVYQNADQKDIKIFDEKWNVLTEEKKITAVKNMFSKLTIDEKNLVDHSWLTETAVLENGEEKIYIGKFYHDSLKLRESVKDKPKPPTGTHKESLLPDTILLHIYRMMKMCVKCPEEKVVENIEKIEIMFGIKKAPTAPAKKTGLVGNLLKKETIENVVGVVNSLIQDGDTQAMLGSIEGDLENVTDVGGALGILMKVMGDGKFMEKVGKAVESSPVAGGPP